MSSVAQLCLMLTSSTLATSLTARVCTDELISSVLLCSVCSCGKWICTSNPCSELSLSRKQDIGEEKETEDGDDDDKQEIFSYDDMDNLVD